MCNITTIPPRFGKIQSLVDSLNQHPIIDEIVIHIPKEYPRFPGKWEFPKLTGAILNIVDNDYGPGTCIVEAKGDIVLYCSDDTIHSPKLTMKLVEKFLGTNKCWCGSGFNFSRYFIGDFKKETSKVQVVEAYAMIVLDRKWIDQIREEFIELNKLTYNDDMIISNLLDKIGVEKHLLVMPDAYQQLDYGFGEDALHFNNGEKTHLHNNKRILKAFRDAGRMYFEPVISYAICVCNEHLELDNLLWSLEHNMTHCDEIVVLVDTNKTVPAVEEVLAKYHVRVERRAFDGNFAEHKNYLNSKCRGSYVFNIDADEIPSADLIHNIYQALNVDLVYIPRVNLLPGANQEFLKSMNFQMTDFGAINWPDMQGRLYRRGLQWVNPLHEKIAGAQTQGQIQPVPQLAIWHVKSLQKMKSQHEYYQKIAPK